MRGWSRIRQWCVWATILFSSTSAEHNDTAPPPLSTTAPPSKELLPTEPLLLISTLDGTLHAVSKRTGIVKWKLDEDPVLHVPMESTTTIKGPTFLPDPHDGSLYAYDPSTQGLSKLPFTIPELVQASPCKSSDGILYTGKKQDVWYAINPITGVKRQVITTEKTVDKCPGGTVEDMFIGRSEYKVTMFDTKSNLMRWNVTFTDYSSHANEKVSHNYELLHLASSADGFVITVDRESGRILWAQNYGYPVVAMYAWVPEGLQKVEMTSVAKETMTYLLRQADGKVSYWDTIFHGNPRFQPKEATLAPSLYVGQYRHSLYALPAMTHDGVQINIHRNVQMLPGPDNSNAISKDRITDLEPLSMTIPIWRLLGYHKIPPYSKINLPQTYPAAHSEAFQIDHEKPSSPGQIIDSGLDPNALSHNSNPFDDPQADIRTSSDKEFRSEKPSSGSTASDEDAAQIRWNEITIVATLTSLITGAFILCLMKKPHFGLPNSSTPSKYDGLIHVGRVAFDPVDILGRGSEGTIVYRGNFDGRKVAVKRVMPECFSFADREVALLRESDEHAHVIRYFCMERDQQFQYIALELCSNTLQEYVENPQYKCSTGLDTQTVLHQAMLGLDHLHRLKIVHRDVKPSNILVSIPGKLGKQRVVISDFGLCKKLVPGRVSFSHRSGTAGTDGWIAPEMILDKRYRMTQAVDIFSMGCVFYYVICGKHPFGDSISRQARIVNGEYSMEELQTFESSEEAMDLIRRMLVVDPSLRPKSDTILNHPLFWDSIKKLQFFEDVSDRIEKEPTDSITMQQLDRDSLLDIQNGIPRDWIQHLCPLLQEDLHKFRAYKAGSVRDLLRAIRNKKHHYRELPDSVKRSLGSIPDEYLYYFTSRFPRLLIHTYLSISCCRHESMFRSYYGESAQDYIFDDGYQSDELLDQTVFTKPGRYQRTAWKNKNNYPMNDGSPRPARALKPLSAADQDLDWRSTGRSDNSTSSSSNSFKSLLKNSNNRHFPNNGKNGRSVEEDFRAERRNYHREDANSVLDSVDITETYTVESRQQYVARKRLAMRGSPRVSESSTVSSEQDSERKAVKSITDSHDSSRRSSNSSNRSMFNGSYAEAVSKSNKNHLSLPADEIKADVTMSDTADTPPIEDVIVPVENDKHAELTVNGTATVSSNDEITDIPSPDTEDPVEEQNESDTNNNVGDPENTESTICEQTPKSEKMKSKPKRRRRLKKNKNKNSSLIEGCEPNEVESVDT